MRIRLLILCLSVCALLAFALQLQPALAQPTPPQKKPLPGKTFGPLPSKQRAQLCNNISRRLHGTLDSYVTYQQLLSRSEDALKFWTARHDQLLREQTEYSRTHLKPSVSIQKALDYARTQMSYKRQQVNEFRKEVALEGDHAKFEYGQMIESFCTDNSVVRQFIAEHPGSLANELARIKFPAPPTYTVDWSGTYENDSQTVTISGEGDSFTARSTWTQPGETHEAQGSEEKWACKANWTQASCFSDGDYHDPDKTIHYKGTIKLSINGSRLSINQHINESACKGQKVPTCDQLGYIPAIHAGADFSSNVTRN